MTISSRTGFSKEFVEALDSLFKKRDEESQNKLIQFVRKQISTIRIGSNPSYDIGKALAYNPVAAVSKPIGRLYRESERFAGVMSGSGFAGQTKGGTLADMRKFYARQERIGNAKASFASVMSGEGISTTAVHSPDKTWMYQLGLARSGVSDDFSYLRDQEKEDADFKARVEASQIRNRIEYWKRRKAGFKRGHDAEVRARLNQIHGYQAFQFDMKSDYDQEVESLTKRYGGGDKGRKRAEEKIRNEAFKKLPGFFKMFGLSNKALFDISKNTKGMPFLTGFLRASKNPITGAAMVLSAAQVGFNISDAANKGVVSNRNAMALFGKPSEKMQEAAGVAGLQDPGEISKRVGKMTLRFGNADMGYKMLGRQMQGMDATTKTFFASAMGLDETDVAIAERMWRGEGTKENSRARRVNAAKNKIEAIKKFGFSSDATLLDSEFWQALWYSIPGMTGAAARDAADFDYVKKGLDTDFNDMLAKMDETKKSAISADRYDAGDYAVATADTGSAAGGGNSTVTLILKTEDGKTVGKRVMKAGEKFTDRVAVADFFDKGE